MYGKIKALIGISIMPEFPLENILFLLARYGNLGDKSQLSFFRAPKERKASKRWDATELS